MADRTQLVRRLFDEAWRNRNAGVLDELCTPDCTFYDAAQGEGGIGVSGYKETMRRFDESFRLLDFTWEPVAESNDTLVCTWTMRARMDGPYAGAPPTGREGRATGVAIIRLQGDKIAEQRSVWDTFGFFEQLGLVEWHGAHAAPEGPGAFA